MREFTNYEDFLKEIKTLWPGVARVSVYDRFGDVADFFMTAKEFTKKMETPSKTRVKTAEVNGHTISFSTWSIY